MHLILKFIGNVRFCGDIKSLNYILIFLVSIFYPNSAMVLSLQQLNREHFFH